MIELMCAVAILGIVGLPLMQSFVLGAQTTDKTAKYGNATQTMESILEVVENQPVSALATELAVIAPVVSSSVAPESTGSVYSYLLKSSSFEADVVLDSREASVGILDPINDIGAASASVLHAVSFQSIGSSADPDFIAYRSYETFKTSTANADDVYSVNDVDGERLITVTLSGVPSNISVQVKYDYSYNYTVTSVDDDGNRTTGATQVYNPTTSSRSFASAQVAGETFGLSIGYFPIYELSEKILISNKVTQDGGAMPLNLVLNKQYLVEVDGSEGKTPGGYTCAAKESSYKCSVYLHEPFGGTPVTQVLTNMSENLAGFGPDPVGPFTEYFVNSTTFDWDNLLTIPGFTMDDMVLIDNYDRIYTVDVTIYSLDINGNRDQEMVNMSTIKLA